MGDCGNTVAVGMSSYALVGVLGGVLGGLARSASAYVEINALEKCSESSRARSGGRTARSSRHPRRAPRPSAAYRKIKFLGRCSRGTSAQRARQTEKA